MQEEDSEWTVVQPNPEALGPYAYNENQWVGYDDEDIVRRKSEFVVEQKLGGIMFWYVCEKHLPKNSNAIKNIQNI